LAIFAAIRSASSRLSSLGAMSALPPKADIGTQPRNVRFVPKADIGLESAIRQASVPEGVLQGR
jgi:hypothetical protein